MSVAVLLCLHVFSDRSAWLPAISGIAAGGLVYALTMATLQIPEWKMLIEVVRKGILKFVRWAS